MRDEYDVRINGRNRRDNQEAERQRMPKHGASFGRIYRDAVAKRAEEQKRAD